MEFIELRSNPELKFLLEEETFEIVDTLESKNSGVYSFAEIKSVALNSEHTNWVVSILSFIVGFFVGGTGGRFKNKANLELELEDKRLKVLLHDTNLKEREKLVELLKSQKEKTND